MSEFALVHFIRKSPVKDGGRHSRPKHGLLVLDFCVAGVSDGERDGKRIGNVIVESRSAATITGHYSIYRSILGSRIDSLHAP